jgi:hypothetical protein
MGSYTEFPTVTSTLSPVDEKYYNDFSPSFQKLTSISSINQVSKNQSQIAVSFVEPEIEVDHQHPSIKDTTFIRTPAFPIEKLPGALPNAEVDADVDHPTVVSSCLKHFNHFNAKIFTNDAIWRDIYALTGTVRTFSGANHIKSVWTELSDLHHQSGFALIPGSSKIVRMGVGCSWIQARFSFISLGQPETLCSGQIGIVPDPNFGWKIWLLTTILEEIIGFPSPDFIGPEAWTGLSSEHDGVSKSSQFDCVVVGAGFSGLCLAGRLKAMGVPSVTLERNSQVGDNWRNRYDSARFHTSRDYSDMPLGGIFTEDDDYFLSGQDLARGYQKFVDKHQINVWVSTTLKSASFDKQSKQWTLYIDRAGEEATLKTPHFVLAIGAGGTIPKMPELANRDLFQGTVLHSVDYKSAHQWKGQKGVIIGTANTAHDVAEDMLDAGLNSTTMVQRGRTSVFPIEYYKKWSDPIYNRTNPIEEADRQIMAIPIAITRQASIRGHNALAATEPERFDALERAGFRVERYGDLWKLLSERLGGHYMDVGASAKVSAGLVCAQGLHANQSTY